MSHAFYDKFNHGLFLKREKIIMKKTDLYILFFVLIGQKNRENSKINSPELVIGSGEYVKVS